MSEDALGQELAELDAFLIEAVHVPDEALEHDLVLEVSEQSAEGFGIQGVADDNAGGASACECLVGVLIVFAAGKGHDLGHDVCAQLFLAGAALDVDIHADLAVFVADELHRDDVCALVQKLIEGVLAVGAGLTEDDGAGHVVDGLAETVDGFAVGLHVELLKVCAGKRHRAWE